MRFLASKPPYAPDIVVWVETFLQKEKKACNFGGSNLSIGTGFLYPGFYARQINTTLPQLARYIVLHHLFFRFFAMKTTRILLLAATFLLSSWCASAVFAQKNESKTSPTKTKQNPQSGEKTTGFIRVTDDDHDHTHEYKSTDAFLGVEPDEDEDPEVAGLVVQVVRGAAADRAGLRHNDKIIRINDTPTNQWSDLSKFIRQAKAGDKVRIAYERNGKPATTEAILGTRKDANQTAPAELRGFLGITEASNRSKGAGLTIGVNPGSGAASAGLQAGDVILKLDDAVIDDFEDVGDFMAYTKPGDQVKVVYERNGKRNTVLVTLGGKGSTNVTVREKEACLGIYTEPFESGKNPGAIINGFTNESAAQAANLNKGDIITAVDGQTVKNHNDLWDEIARHQIGDQVKVAYTRDGKAANTTVRLKPCRDNNSHVQIIDDSGQQLREFRSWNWSEQDQRLLDDSQIITIRRGEGDGAMATELLQATEGNRLQLRNFRTISGQSTSHLTISFGAEPAATIVSLFDLSGRQLFREELNAFNGRYSQQFDLTEYANGSIMVHVQQDGKVFREQLDLQ